MLDVVFSPSAAGTIKVIQSLSLERIREGNDLFCFALHLSVGDVSGDCLSEQRERSLSDLYAIFPEEHPVLRRTLADAKTSLTRLLARAGQGEPIRIWYSENPDEYCGMCWLMSELARRTDLPEIRLMALPNQVEAPHTIQLYQGWGEVSPEEFSSLWSLEKTASPAFLMKAKGEWADAQEKAMPLRAFINGRLHSVPEDFYDFFIRQEIRQLPPEFNEAVLIGNVLGRYQMKIGDMWIAARIEEMIARGELSPLSAPKDGDMVYRRMLKKNSAV